MASITKIKDAICNFWTFQPVIGLGGAFILGYLMASVVSYKMVKLGKIIKMGNFEIDSEDFLAYWRAEMLYAMINLNSGLILKLKYLTLILNGFNS